jgi:hypothetical protein
MKNVLSKCLDLKSRIITQKGNYVSTKADRYRKRAQIVLKPDHSEKEGDKTLTEPGEACPANADRKMKRTTGGRMDN